MQRDHGEGLVDDPIVIPSLFAEDTNVYSSAI
jgi:hypothetical protein